MTSLKPLSTCGAVALLVAGSVTVTLARTTATVRQGSSMYDVKTETTIKGAVESVETVTGSGGRGRRALGGTHLVVKTEKEVLEVHVGPKAYLAEKKITLAKGDQLEILGSRVTVDNETFLAPGVRASKMRRRENAFSLT